MLIHTIRQLGIGNHGCPRKAFIVSSEWSDTLNFPFLSITNFIHLDRPSMTAYKLISHSLIDLFILKNKLNLLKKKQNKLSLE